ncbi:carnitine dehydratase [Janibacter sp. Soil728]|uniref:CaiB/BaiF CoA transferase family protein n=1 Tax=Janibacter sp. Soil728 TaxID=1736393 RepID=UPI0006F83AE0|nr:CaiB/BaiF CoA-transferase family protein [Janibacter sp. Soil728]KRE39381.1 carnitine dehydratase [Janibacter sp. Soil728]
MSDTAASGPSGPLAGVRVLELSGIGPGPFCAMMLADLGADVVRVHRAGDQAAINPVLDRGRRSIAVDLKSPRGVQLVRDLTAGSDILLEGFRPGVLERLGLDPASLLEINPALVIGRMTGFGQDGPFAPRAGHDINYISMSGALAAIGRKGAAPTPPLNLVGDFGGGGMLLALGVVSAVLSARTTGRGQVVDASMVEGSAALMAMIYGYRSTGRWDLARGEQIFDSGAPFYDSYVCSDGGYMAVGAVEPQFFATLVEQLGLTGQVDLERQRQRETWDHQRELFSEAFAGQPRAHWEAVFADVDACVTPVLDMDEAPCHPHNVARSAFVEIDGAAQPAPVPRFSGTATAVPTSAPSVGRDTDAILAELGLDASTTTALREDGIVT